MRIISVDIVHPVLRSELEAAGHEFLDLSEESDEQIVPLLKKADGIVMRSRLNVSHQFLQDHPRLKFVGRVGSGLENIDQVSAERSDVVIFNSPEGNRESVAEHALGMLLAWLNNLIRADRDIRGGEWNRLAHRGEELQGKTVAIIGFGNTGSAFAKLLGGIGVKVLAYDKYKRGFQDSGVTEATMEDVFREAEVVSLHLPLNVETKFLVNDEWIDSFEKPFVLINTSRGQIVNTGAVIRGMQKESIRGCCLDVLEYENERLKMPDFSTLPEPFHAILASDRTILSPHCAGLSPESYLKLSKVMADKIIHRFGRA